MRNTYKYKQTDESLCQPTCPPNYCTSHGKCTLVNNGGPTCNCDDGYVGVRCEKKRDPVEQKDTGVNGGNDKIKKLKVKIYV